jgi:hypothetical protein
MPRCGALAKRLMRLRYHLQALEVIEKNRSSLLSTATLEMYSSWFLYVFTEVNG